MDCASCVAHVEKALRAVPGVESSVVNLARGRAAGRFDPARPHPRQPATAVTNAGYPTVPETPGVAQANVEEERLQRQTRAARTWFRRAVVGIVLWLPLEATHWVLQVASPHSGHAE